MDFVALDFETATRDRASACAIGLAFVEGDRVTQTRSWLIRPPGNKYDGYNISIHGIHPVDTANAPTFAELWPEVRESLSGNLGLAHYAAFDMSVLRSTLDHHGVPYPEMEYLCTYVLARHAWPNLVSYKLRWLANEVGIEFDHHNAEEDARAAAEIAIRCQDVLGGASLRQVAESTDVRVGQLFDGGYRPCGHRSAWSVTDITPEEGEFDPAHPFYEKTVVFTGSLANMVRKEAMQAVVNCGGRCTTSVSGQTDFLVVGDQDFSQFREGQTKSSKMRKAESLAAEGNGIELIPEEDFLRMLGEV